VHLFITIYCIFDEDIVNLDDIKFLIHLPFYNCFYWYSNHTTIRSLLTRKKGYVVKVKIPYCKGSLERACFHVFLNRHDEITI